MNETFKFVIATFFTALACIGVFLIAAGAASEKIESNNARFQELKGIAWWVFENWKW